MKKKVKIYFPFTLNQLKRQASYRGAFYLFVLSTLFGSFINYYLWMAIYHNSSTGLIGGLSKEEMVIYVFMSYITSYLVMVEISNDIGNDVVKGNVAGNLIKPIDYRIYLIFNSLGAVIYRLVAPCIFVWVGLEVYRIFVLKIPMVSVVNLVFYIISTIASYLIYILFDFCFGMIAFYTTYIFGISIVKNSILSFLTGQLIPLTLFPMYIQRVLGILPFSSMVFSPVMIYLGKYSVEETIFILVRQMIWIVILYVVGSLIWKKVTKRLVILGG